MAAIAMGACVFAGCEVQRTEITAPTADVAADTHAEASTSGVDTTTTTATTTTGTTGSTTTSSSTTTTSTSTANSADALDLSQVATWILPALPGVSSGELISAKVTATINSAWTNGDKLYTSYDRYSFPADGGTDAVCYFFYKQGGKVVGGKFDYWRTGGQSVKTLENVHENYGGHSMPSRGTECWTMISSKDGSQRSNTCSVTWK
jgi:hypothetical protein